MKPEQLAILVLIVWLSLNAVVVAWRLVLARRADDRRRRLEESGQAEYLPWRDLRTDQLTDGRGDA